MAKDKSWVTADESFFSGHHTSFLQANWYICNCALEHLFNLPQSILRDILYNFVFINPLKNKSIPRNEIWYYSLLADCMRCRNVLFFPRHTFLNRHLLTHTTLSFIISGNCSLFFNICTRPFYKEVLFHKMIEHFLVSSIPNVRFFSRVYLAWQLLH